VTQDHPYYTPGTVLDFLQPAFGSGGKGDEPSFAACGRPSDLSEEEILVRVLALNLERSKTE
jgi:hypothetical protein